MSLYPIYFPNKENANVILHREGAVFWLTMTYQCSKFNPTSIKAIFDALDHVEDMALVKEKGSPCSLITTGEKKYYNTGLDLQYLIQNEAPWFISDQYVALLKRMLTFPVITVAGWLCLNEIDLPGSLHPGMAALARTKLPPSSYRNMVFTGQRYTAVPALKDALVDEITPLSDLKNKAQLCALKYAEKVAKAGDIVGQLKLVSYQDIVAALNIRLRIDVRDFVKSKL
ncbi:hypothetical protein HMI56_002198 [Coelomomyces lativittatus]|nr:hypothetical protein HMI56_002198 [Coelomomyces lativittatus]